MPPKYVKKKTKKKKDIRFDSCFLLMNVLSEFSFSHSLSHFLEWAHAGCVPSEPAHALICTKYVKQLIQTRNCSNFSKTSVSERVFMLPCGDGPNPYGAPLLISESPEEDRTRRGHVAALLSPILSVIRSTLSNYEIIKHSKQKGNPLTLPILT